MLAAWSIIVHEEKRQLRIAYQREECEHQANKLIYKLDVKKHLSCDGVVCLPDLFEVYQRIDSCKKCSIEPSSPLRDEFWNSICFPLSVFKGKTQIMMD